MEIPGVEHDGKNIRKFKTENFVGSYHLMFFFPLGKKTDSDEVLDFSSSLQDFNNLGCKVVGVTSESPLAITRWMEKEAETGGFGRVIGFPILSDKDLAFSSRLGVARNCGMPAKSCFIIDPQGKIRYSVIQYAGIKHNVPELVRLVKAFKKSDETGKAAPAGWQADESDLVPTDYTEKVAFFAKKYGTSGGGKSGSDITSVNSQSGTLTDSREPSVQTKESGSSTKTGNTISSLTDNDISSDKLQSGNIADAFTISPSVESNKTESGPISSRTRSSTGSTIQDEIRRVEKDSEKFDLNTAKNADSTKMSGKQESKIQNQPEHIKK